MRERRELEHKHTHDLEERTWIHSFTILPVVIEILTRMSYIISVGTNLGLGSSGLALQTYWLDADVKSLVLDNRGSLVKGLPVIPCVIEIVPGFWRARNDVNFKARLAYVREPPKAITWLCRVAQRGWRGFGLTINFHSYIPFITMGNGKIHSISMDWI